MRQALNNVEQEFRSQPWEYLNNRLNLADLTIEAPNQTTFKSVLSYRDKKSELIVLLSDGSIQLVNWVTSRFTLLGKIDPKGFSSWSSSVPALAATSPWPVAAGPSPHHKPIGPFGCAPPCWAVCW
jgi:hypothetical protein